jgi:hypothetical protein
MRACLSLCVCLSLCLSLSLSPPCLDWGPTAVDMEVVALTDRIKAAEEAAAAEASAAAAGELPKHVRGRCMPERLPAALNGFELPEVE